MPRLIPYIERCDRRTALHKFHYSRHSDNPYCMDLLLDFIQTKYAMRPIQSPGELIVFLPKFLAITGTALEATSIWLSLLGRPDQFDGRDTTRGRYLAWSNFHITCRDDIARAKDLIEQSYQILRRQHCNLGFDEILEIAEQQWLDEQNRTEMRRIVEWL